MRGSLPELLHHHHRPLLKPSCCMPLVLERSCYSLPMQSKIYSYMEPKELHVVLTFH
uniref:Uncharacterized protein n=1 Tax=Rhizophora mucronata TaxID=61149 RepID=A0A2P2P1R3_RHIMU